jgi:hypothetical protein
MSVSPSRMSAREETFRSTVGRDAEVPRKRRESDIRGIYRDLIPARRRKKRQLEEMQLNERGADSS